MLPCVKKGKKRNFLWNKNVINIHGTVVLMFAL